MTLAALLAAALAATPAQREEARQLSARSIVEYNAGDFEKALADITRAYELDPRPGLLYNLGQCNRVMEHWKQAKFFFEGYLREFPDAPNRERVLELIADMDRNIAEQERKEAAVREALTAPAPAPAPAPQIIVEAPPPAPVTAEAVFGGESKPPEHKGLKIAGWTLAGLGIAAGIAGGVLEGVAAGSRPAQLSGPGVPAPAYVSQPAVNNYNVSIYAADTAFGVGAALVIAGAVLLFTSS